MTVATVHAGNRPGLVYERRGTGEPLLLLHGFGHSRRAWDPVMSRLAAERDVIAIDMPGFGASRWPKGSPFGIDTVVAHIGAFLESIGVDRPHVAGNSLGGVVSLELARQDRVASATVLSPAAFISVAGSLYVGTVILGFQHLALATPDRFLRDALKVRPVRNALLLSAFGRPSKVSDEAVISLLGSLREAPLVASHMKSLSRLRFRGDHEIDVPVTVSWGTRDLILWPQQVRTARRALPRARMVPLPGCGHVPMSDDPELVARVILEGSSSRPRAGSRPPAGPGELRRSPSPEGSRPSRTSRSARAAHPAGTSGTVGR
ncbi:MAG: alpha/beta fold hydrolase [Actinomycetota bacterium]|nr:alpha/beta fold hydrolase [Actinomycetota bacterium]